MTWSRFDDRATEALKVRRAGTAACCLWFAAVNWCNRERTDGVIERDLLTEVWRPVGEVFDHEAAARACVAAGLFETTPEGDYLVHDFLDYNPSKAEQKAAQKAAAERQRKCRQRKAALATVTPLVTRDAGRVTPSRDETDPVTRAGSAAAPDVRHASVTAPRPVPSRPDPSESVARTHAHAREREAAEPDPTPSEPWTLWLSLRDAAGFGFDPPVHRESIATAWQHVERKLAAKLAATPTEAFERLCRTYLEWPEGKPLPGGKAPVRGDRPGSWLASGVYQLADHLTGGPKGQKPAAADEAALRRRLAAQRDARTA